SGRPRAEPPNDAAAIVAPDPGEFGRTLGGYFGAMVGLIGRFIRRLLRAIRVLVRRGPKIFCAKMLEGLRAKRALSGGPPLPVPTARNDLPPPRLDQQHHWADAPDSDELLDQPPSPIPGIRSIGIDKLLPTGKRVAEATNDRRVDIIVPVYRGFAQTR